MKFLSLFILTLAFLQGCPGGSGLDGKHAGKNVQNLSELLNKNSALGKSSLYEVKQIAEGSVQSSGSISLENTLKGEATAADKITPDVAKAAQAEIKAALADFKMTNFITTGMKIIAVASVHGIPGEKGGNASDGPHDGPKEKGGDYAVAHKEGGDRGKMGAGGPAPTDFDCPAVMKDPLEALAKVSGKTKAEMTTMIDDYSKSMKDKVEGCKEVNVTKFTNCMEYFNTLIAMVDESLDCNKSLEASEKDIANKAGVPLNKLNEEANKCTKVFKEGCGFLYADPADPAGGKSADPADKPATGKPGKDKGAKAKN